MLRSSIAIIAAWVIARGGRRLRGTAGREQMKDWDDIFLGEGLGMALCVLRGEEADEMRRLLVN